jgi:predicted choloylglycine hydrolase
MAFPKMNHFSIININNLSTADDQKVMIQVTNNAMAQSNSFKSVFFVAIRFPLLQVYPLLESAQNQMITL